MWRPLVCLLPTSDTRGNLRAARNVQLLAIIAQPGQVALSSWVVGLHVELHPSIFFVCNQLRSAKEKKKNYLLSSLTAVAWLTDTIPVGKSTLGLLSPYMTPGNQSSLDRIKQRLNDNSFLRTPPSRFHNQVYLLQNTLFGRYPPLILMKHNFTVCSYQLITLQTRSKSAAK